MDPALPANFVSDLNDPFLREPVNCERLMIYSDYVRDKGNEVYADVLHTLANDGKIPLRLRRSVGEELPYYWVWISSDPDVHSIYVTRAKLASIHKYTQDNWAVLCDAVNIYSDRIWFSHFYYAAMAYARCI